MCRTDPIANRSVPCAVNDTTLPCALEVPQRAGEHDRVDPCAVVTDVGDEHGHDDAGLVLAVRPVLPVEHVVVVEDLAGEDSGGGAGGVGVDLPAEEAVRQGPQRLVVQRQDLQLDAAVMAEPATVVLRRRGAPARSRDS
jgi:hypothetical protein